MDVCGSGININCQTLWTSNRMDMMAGTVFNMWPQSMDLVAGTVLYLWPQSTSLTLSSIPQDSPPPPPVRHGWDSSSCCDHHLPVWACWHRAHQVLPCQPVEWLVYNVLQSYSRLLSTHSLHPGNCLSSVGVFFLWPFLLLWLSISNGIDDFEVRFNLL